MKIEKLLFVTKFEKLCYTALQSLLDLRSAALHHVVFMNVIERDRIAMKRGIGYKKDEERRLREAANIRFIDWAEDLFEQGMEVGVYIVVGSLVSQVISAAEKEGADLIVIGRPQQKSLWQQLYSGSDITELVRRSTIPTLVFKHMAQRSLVPEKLFKRPLLAVDWSPASERAVAYLVELKSIIEEVNVLHVVGEKELTGSSNMDIQKTRKERRQKLAQTCAVFEKAGIATQSHVLVGDTTDQLDKAGHESRASLMVLGTSSKPALMEKWLGSTPLAIAEKSDFPTLLIPPGRR